MEVDAAREEAEDYLRSLLNKNLRVTATDSRLFCGQFKCTDPVCRSSSSHRNLARWWGFS